MTIKETFCCAVSSFRCKQSLGDAEVIPLQRTKTRTPEQALAAHCLELLGRRRPQQSSFAHVPLCGSGALIEELLRRSLPENVPRTMIASDNSVDAIDAIWHKISEGELTGDGWEHVETRLLDPERLDAIKTGHFSHTFLHLRPRFMRDPRLAVAEAVRTTEVNGVVVLTTWQHDGLASLVREVANLCHEQSDTLIPLARHSPGRIMLQEMVESVNSSTAEWQISRVNITIAVRDWDIEALADLAADEIDAATDGWTLASKARFEQALRMTLAKAMTRGETVQYTAEVAIRWPRLRTGNSLDDTSPDACHNLV